jgi:hypothetical protein
VGGWMMRTVCWRTWCSTRRAWVSGCSQNHFTYCGVQDQIATAYRNLESSFDYLKKLQV